MPTSDRSGQRTPRNGAEASERATDAVARARKHAHAAIAEALASVSALLDASSLALSGETAEKNALLRPISKIFEGIRAELDDGATGDVAALLHSIAEALDAEISRWETRAESDPDARAVLRAFLGLRELLWEFGIRREPEPKESEKAPARTARRKGSSTTARRKPPRVQRVTVEG